MTCCTRARLPQARTTARSASPQGAGEIMGTWDFKWPEGAELRVAFQRPPGVSTTEFTDAKTAIIALAQRWHQSRNPLRFSFDTPDFGPPEFKQQGKHPQNRTSTTSEAWREYDILISLEPIKGLTRTDTIGGKTEHIFMPQSEVGSYARRIDFGTPSMYLGPMSGYVGKLDAYYESGDAIMEMMVVHEFGHALGLGHEHQSPLARAALGLSKASYDFDKAREILINRFGVAPTDLPKSPETAEFLEAHLGLPWPGNPRFSDWRAYARGSNINSIMSVAYHDCALLTNPHHCTSTGCTVMQILTYPTTEDFDALRAMYS